MLTHPIHPFPPQHTLPVLALALVGGACAPTIPEPDFRAPEDLFDTDSPAPLATLPEQWRGERTVMVGDCIETISERGPPSSPAEVVRACPDCDITYQLRLRPRRPCGLAFDSPSWRGLRRLEGGGLEVLLMRAPGGEGTWHVFRAVEAQPTGDGGWDYSYEVASFGSYGVEGTFEGGD